MVLRVRRRGDKFSVSIVGKMAGSAGLSALAGTGYLDCRLAGLALGRDIDE